jgi:radical SAM protein with 4Fe4S-binding SPASM domain
MFEKYGIPFNNLYLLEVRDPNWTVKQCEDFEQFIKFLVHWCWDACGHNLDKMIEFIFKGKGFNFLSNGVTTVGRGIGCSIQTALMLRLGDLKFSPCHRTSYDFMNGGEFKVKDGKIDGITAINPSLFFTINAFNISSVPMCNTCPISQFCSGGCLGSQYETTGDPFSPIPTVCRMNFYKLRALFSTYKEIGIMPKILNILGETKVNAYKYCLKENIL